MNKLLVLVQYLLDITVKYNFSNKAPIWRKQCDGQNQRRRFALSLVR